MRLILVRHGESLHSVDGIISSRVGCRGLTERGCEQGRLLAARWQRTNEIRDCVALVSSPVPRARQTAEILHEQLSATPIIEDSALTEIDAGVADGLSWERYHATYALFDLVAAPDRPFAPGGESWRQFVGRVEATLVRMAVQFAGHTVVAVSHAGFIVATLLALFAIPRPGTNARIEPRHTSLTEWRHDGNIWRLERFNDCAHLDG